jgi:cardiolipin synthase
MLRFFNPANLATLARLLLTPRIAFLIFHDRHLAALILFFLAGLTDVLDGGLARRYGWHTPAGAYLDPIADKVLLGTVYICLALQAGIPWWFVGIIFARDILILLAAGAALTFTTIRRFPPTVWGKFSTFMQIFTATAWMIRDAFPSPTLTLIARGLVWPAAAATLWSGLHYAWRGLRLVQTAE